MTHLNGTHPYYLWHRHVEKSEEQLSRRDDDCIIFEVTQQRVAVSTATCEGWKRDADMSWSSDVIAKVCGCVCSQDDKSEKLLQLSQSAAFIPALQPGEASPLATAVLRSVADCRWSVSDTNRTHTHTHVSVQLHILVLPKRL